MISFSAVLLAAGRSTRMGRDKALLEVDGKPLWERQRDVLARAGATEIFLSARPDQSWVRATRGFAAVLHDSSPDCGPISGITAALERTTGTHVAVLAIDLPHVPAEWFGELRADCEPASGAVGRHDDFFEPLAAIYPRTLMPLAWAALAGGHYGLQELLRSAVAAGTMRARHLSAAELVWFRNWNSSADVAPVRH
jgi:molybdopterin-guanine dinucleotide biosynthesis protein A